MIKWAMQNDIERERCERERDERKRERESGSQFPFAAWRLNKI